MNLNHLFIIYWFAKYFVFQIDGPKSVTIQYSTYYPSLDKYLIERKDHINITCKADCYPECTYLFYKNEKLLNNIYINKWVHMSRSMSGRYTCAAKNSMVKTYMNSSNFEDIYIKCAWKLGFFYILYFIWLINSIPSSLSVWYPTI